MRTIYKRLKKVGTIFIKAQKAPFGVYSEDSGFCGWFFCWRNEGSLFNQRLNWYMQVQVDVLENPFILKKTNTSVLKKVLSFSKWLNCCQCSDLSWSILFWRERQIVSGRFSGNCGADSAYETMLWLSFMTGYRIRLSWVITRYLPERRPHEEASFNPKSGSVQKLCFVFERGSFKTQISFHGCFCSTSLKKCHHHRVDIKLPVVVCLVRNGVFRRLFEVDKSKSEVSVGVSLETSAAIIIHWRLFFLFLF